MSGAGGHLLLDLRLYRFNGVSLSLSTLVKGSLHLMTGIPHQYNSSESY